jgi:hypothetical protein
MTNSTIISSHQGEGEAVPRFLWRTMEPYHAMVYFAPEAREIYAAAGLKGFWMGYFGSRAAALGPVPATVVEALFYNFDDKMVARAIPDAWRMASPDRILAARYQIADSALHRLLGEEALRSQAIVECSQLARQAAESCPIAGRALFAAHTALPWPDQPHMVLWHAATLLREFRGDGHVTALLSARIDGCEAHLTLTGTGAVGREALQPFRGWSDDAWERAKQRLLDRGWLDAEGRLTEAGSIGRRGIEEMTDQLAEAPWMQLGQQDCAQLAGLMWPISDRIVRQGGIPIPNPMGLGWP